MTPLQENAWYASWFDSPYYHVLYKNRDDREARNFLDNLFSCLAPQPQASILDLACGKGRHAIYLGQKGFSVTGVDLSERSICLARESSEGAASFEVHDIREVYRKSSFELVLNLFTSFGYFESLDDNRAVLEAAYADLKLEGLLVIDFLNSESVINNLIPHEHKVVDGVHFDLWKSVENGTIVKAIRIEDGEENLQYEERVRAFSRNELVQLIQEAGLEVVHEFGNYQLEAFDAATSPRLVLVAKKSAA